MSHNIPPNPGTRWLILAGTLSMVAAVLHLGVIAGGPDWYRFFGAGEEMAQAAERGSWMPAIVTLGIAALLALWGLFAFSGTGTIRRLPLLRTALVAISAIYLLRGLVIVPVFLFRPQGITGIEPWASLIVLAYGAAYALGTAPAWRAISPPLRRAA